MAAAGLNPGAEHRMVWMKDRLSLYGMFFV